MGCGPNRPGDQSAATAATQAANLARHFRSIGHEIMDWEVCNEWAGGGGQGVALSTYESYFTTIGAALHDINANYKIWGPAELSPGTYDLRQFANDVGTACGGVLWHSYDANTDLNGNLTDSLAVVYGSKGAQSPNASNTRHALSRTALADVEIGPLEYNLATASPPIWSGNQDGTYIGGVWLALILIGMWRSTSNMTVGAIWDIGGDSSFGLIANQQQGSSIGTLSPQGYYLGYAGQHMGGNEVIVTTTLNDMQIVATVRSNNFAIQLVNYDTRNGQAVSIATAGRLPRGAIRRWEIGKSSHNAPRIGTQPSLGSISVPSESIVMLTGTLQ
jgi:hypothetical protein